MKETIDFIIKAIFWWFAVSFGLGAIYAGLMWIRNVKNGDRYPEIPPYLTPEEHDECYRCQHDSE